MSEAGNLAPECRAEECESRTVHASGWCRVHRYTYQRAMAKNGILHRSPLTDGPNAMIDNDWKNDRPTRHRVGGPARVIERADGTVFAAWWVREGVGHRIDGPAYIGFDQDEQMVSSSWSFDGVEVLGFEGIAKRLAELDEDDLVVELDLSDYGVLIDEGVEPGSILTALGVGVGTVDGIREVLAGAPAEWVRSFEDGRVLGWVTA